MIADTELSLLKCVAVFPFLSLFLFYVAIVTGGGLNAVLSAVVWVFLGLMVNNYYHNTKILIQYSLNSSIVLLLQLKTILH